MTPCVQPPSAFVAMSDSYNLLLCERHPGTGLPKPPEMTMPP
jgi:hypothetical protein